MLLGLAAPTSLHMLGPAKMEKLSHVRLPLLYSQESQASYVLHVSLGTHT